MWAMRKLGHAWLLTGPQLGFVMPERLVEIELHSPSLNVRGTTAAGAPVIGIGHNEHVAWGVTSGLGDEDDLYAEQLVGDEGYRFRGKTETMECRDETFTYRPPPADFLALLDLEAPDTSTGSHTERVCRTVHGPVQEVVEGEGHRLRAQVRDLEARGGDDRGPRQGQPRRVDRGRRRRSRRAHLEREPDGRRRPREHRVLEPGPHAASGPSAGTSGFPSRAPAARSGRASCRPTTGRRSSTRARAGSPTGTTRPRSARPTATGRRRSERRACSTAASTWRASWRASIAADRPSRRCRRSTA